MPDLANILRCSNCDSSCEYAMHSPATSCSPACQYPEGHHDYTPPEVVVYLVIESFSDDVQAYNTQVAGVYPSREAAMPQFAALIADWYDNDYFNVFHDDPIQVDIPDCGEATASCDDYGVITQIQSYTVTHRYEDLP